ncbi:unnamed protein product [Lactuca virosa]|uniref:Uncharacterized protein n=1 Tax=Lactuca virosa TaxID=75947 RepID=A0AAU9PXR7_9ASTR|nr:unnamed protein product [Lactuca virosa]
MHYYVSSVQQFNTPFTISLAFFLQTSTDYTSTDYHHLQSHQQSLDLSMILASKAQTRGLDGIGVVAVPSTGIKSYTTITSLLKNQFELFLLIITSGCSSTRFVTNHLLNMHLKFC